MPKKKRKMKRKRKMKAKRLAGEMLPFTDFRGAAKFATSLIVVTRAADTLKQLR